MSIADIAREELLALETRYLSNLNILVNCFARPFQIYCSELSKEDNISTHLRGLLNKNVAQVIFFDVASLRDLSAHVVESLNANQPISDVFQYISPYLKLYASYIRNFESSNEHIVECLRNPTFKTFFRACELQPNVKLSVQEYMTLPLTHIQSYRIILERIMDQYSKKNMSESVSVVLQTMTSLTESIKAIEDDVNNHNARLKVIEYQSLFGLSFATPSRYFVLDGHVLRIRSDGRSTININLIIIYKLMI